MKGETYNAKESDYYDLLDKILDIKYYGIGRSTILLFRCTCFDNDNGVVVNPNGLVDVKHNS